MMAKHALTINVTFEITRFLFDNLYRKAWERAVNRAYWRLKK